MFDSIILSLFRFSPLPTAARSFQMASKSEVASPDFSQPWKLSDLVLVVEEERFHVHKAMLAFWSPVFEKMFTSEFQEKDKNEVPLPGKKASEIEEMLRQIYPSVTERAITQENCYFLVKLAHEYQMAAIVTRCEDFMTNKVKVKAKESILADLVFAQTYKLKKLKLASVTQAHCLSLEELKTYEMLDQIQPDNLQEIMEGIIKRLQRELNGARTQLQERQKKIDNMSSYMRYCLSHVEKIAKDLVGHASSKQSYSYIGCTDTASYLAALQKDTSAHYCTCKGIRITICRGLSEVSSDLSSIKQLLEEFLHS
ncbi:BTB and MATH domain-containing protein 38-like [Orbicella faveolata]|uniref:BTB and MATH domain-containing protein 38-like n=1 Tax=Orbicella faveolata TaxID=48498 RepID=UPI0009E21870|nr:BTB and MATH domain-containing protein 38-like [Orbicella faveolata]